MFLMSSTEVQNAFGKALQQVAVAPVSISCNNAVVAIMLSPAEYERLSQLEDFYLGLKARKAEQEGLIGPEETMRLLREKLGLGTDA